MLLGLRCDPSGGSHSKQHLPSTKAITLAAAGPSPVPVACAVDLSPVLALPSAHRSAVAVLGFHAINDRIIMSGGGDGVVKLWDRRSGGEFLKFGGHSGAITVLKTLPHGKAMIAGTADGKLMVRRLPLRGGSAVLPKRGDGNSLERAGGAVWGVDCDKRGHLVSRALLIKSITYVPHQPHCSLSLHCCSSCSCSLARAALRLLRCPCSCSTSRQAR